MMSLSPQLLVHGLRAYPCLFCQASRISDSDLSFKPWWPLLNPSFLTKTADVSVHSPLFFAIGIDPSAGHSIHFHIAQWNWRVRMHQRAGEIDKRATEKWRKGAVWLERCLVEMICLWWLVNGDSQFMDSDNLWKFPVCKEYSNSNSWTKHQGCFLKLPIFCLVLFYLTLT